MTATFSIGAVHLKNPVVVAPMAGVTDSVFRKILKRQGAALVYTEMISSLGITYENQNTRTLLKFDPEERPIAIQLFGSDSQAMARAATVVEKLGADILDINMACPVNKVVKNGDGCALMKRPEKIGEIVAAVKEKVSIPVTIKIRAGWDSGSINAPEVARMAEKAGASAVAVHGRTRLQMYSGKADWSVIQKVKESVSIPVLGSGDVFTPQDVKNMMEETGCDGVMLGRGVLGNPWLVGQALELLETGKVSREVSMQERIAMTWKHTQAMVHDKGEKVGIREARKHLAWYFHGLPDSARMRKLLFTVTSLEELQALLNDYLCQHGEEAQELMGR